MTEVQFEAALIWSYEDPDRLEGRTHRAYNQVFSDNPTREQLAVMVAGKQKDIEASPGRYPDPAMHRLEVRRVEKYDADLASIVAEYNAGQDGE